MSNWTHICGMVRFDDLGGILGKNYFTTENLVKCFGEMDSYNEKKYCCPTGSEGSLKYTLYKDFEAIEDHCICNTYMMIHGDLRDYDTPKEVIKWFKKAIKLCQKNGLFVRDAVISAYAEREIKPYTWCKQEEEYKDYLKEKNK